VGERPGTGGARRAAIVRKRAAGAVVVRTTDSGARYLVLRAFRNWDFPKGLIEPGESPLDAARREVAEETSLTVAFPWGDDFRETEPYAGGKVARFYLAAAGDGDVVLAVSPALGRPEHHEFRWATYEQARALLPPRLQSILDWAHAVVAR
jgi:bis(5'-nucleosidyl)-tetraphosphatase